MAWYQSSSSACTPTCDTIYWPVWHDTAATYTATGSTTATGSSYTSTSNIVWPTWHDSIVIPAIMHRQGCQLEEARAQARAQQIRVDSQRRETADAKAKELLLQLLTPEQREMVEKRGWFVVQGGKSGKLYRVHSRGIAGNVEELRDEKAVARFCCHLEHQYPAPDHHLAQMLMLKNDEDTFLRLANKTALVA